MGGWSWFEHVAYQSDSRKKKFKIHWRARLQKISIGRSLKHLLDDVKTKVGESLHQIA